MGKSLKGTRTEQIFYLEFMCEIPGKKVDKSKYDLISPLFIQWYYEQGDKVEPINGFFEKVGYHITKKKTSSSFNPE